MAPWLRLKNVFILLLVISLPGLMGDCATVSSTGGGSQGGSNPPFAPTGVQATAGEAKVNLTWSASTGAASYNVKRATTSGGRCPPSASPPSRFSKLQECGFSFSNLLPLLSLHFRYLSHPK